MYTYAADKYPSYVTGGDPTIGFPAENDAISRNIRQYEELLNSRELMEGRALFPCDLERDCRIFCEHSVV